MPRVIAPPRQHLTEDGERAFVDRWLYHNPDGEYRSTVGIMMEHGDGSIEVGCVGCWYCCGPTTDYHAHVKDGCAICATALAADPPQ